MSKIAKKSKFIAAKMVKMAIFGTSKWPKLISRKIWQTEKYSNFHTVQFSLTRNLLLLILDKNCEINVFTKEVTKELISRTIFSMRVNFSVFSHCGLVGNTEKISLASSLLIASFLWPYFTFCNRLILCLLYQ